MMSTLMENQRNELALKMLSAWVNCSPEKMPEQYKAWTDDYSRQAWQRVAQAAENHFRAQLAAAEADKLAYGERVREAAISVANGISNGYDQLAENHPNEDAKARLHARSRAISHVIIHIRALDLSTLAEGEK